MLFFNIVNSIMEFTIPTIVRLIAEPASSAGSGGAEEEPDRVVRRATREATHQQSRRRQGEGGQGKGG
jgi:hypothetical protein